MLSTTHLDGNIHSAHLVDSTLVVGSNFTRRPPDLGVVPVEPGGGEDGEGRADADEAKYMDAYERYRAQMKRQRDSDRDLDSDE